MSFGYFPDFKNKFPLKDWYLRIFGYPYAPRRNEVVLVFKLLDAKPGEKILDIGCGDGIWTNQLAKTNQVKVIGIDTSKHDLALAKKRAELMSIKNVSYKQMDAGKMPFANNSFDKIYSISTFEHIKDEIAALKEVLRILKTGGIFVLSVPQEKVHFLARLFLPLSKKTKKTLKLNRTITSSEDINDYLCQRNKRFHHFRNYHLEPLKNRLEKTGFNVKKIEYHNKLLGRIANNIIHTFDIFNWQKKSKTDYHFSSEIIHALTFPFFILLYLTDRLIPYHNGHNLIISCLKGADDKNN